MFSADKITSCTQHNLNLHSLSSFFVTASYDAQIRFFDSSQKLVHTIAGHTAPISSICLVPQPNAAPETHLIASASHDMTARLTSVANLALDAENQLAPSSRTLASLHLHTAPLSSISASPSGSHLLTASWDTLIGLWDTSIPTGDEVPLAQDERKKRRRVGDEGEGGDGERPRRKAPASVLKSHTRRVMKALFDRTGTSAYSCALDSTVRTWDVESGVCTNTVVSSS